MNGVNLDLLHIMPHAADGSPKDLHAHHRAEHLAILRAARRARWRSVLTRVAALLRSSLVAPLLAARDEKTKSHEARSALSPPLP